MTEQERRSTKASRSNSPWEQFAGSLFAPFVELGRCSFRTGSASFRPTRGDTCRRAREIVLRVVAEPQLTRVDTHLRLQTVLQVGSCHGVGHLGGHLALVAAIESEDEIDCERWKGGHKKHNILPVNVSVRMFTPFVHEQKRCVRAHVQETVGSQRVGKCN